MILVDGDNGIGIDDCVAISRHVGFHLEEENVIETAYNLEVSSPGIERGLYKLADYERFTGSLVKLQTREAINGSRNFQGRLQSFRDGRLTLEVPAKKKVPVTSGTFPTRSWPSAISCRSRRCATAVNLRTRREPGEPIDERVPAHRLV